jgi:hypothetical protein
MARKAQPVLPVSAGNLQAAIRICVMRPICARRATAFFVQSVDFRKPLNQPGSSQIEQQNSSGGNSGITAGNSDRNSDKSAIISDKNITGKIRDFTGK